MGHKKQFIFIFICTTLLELGKCLECYVCMNQDANDVKCLKSIMTCEPGEEMCMTEIKWGTMPYWQAGADKQFYITKTCATKQRCEKTIRKYMPYCTHIWYEDWKCAECCQGDRCNYYIISGGPACRAASISLVLALALLVVNKLMLAL